MNTAVRAKSVTIQSDPEFLAGIIQPSKLWPADAEIERQRSHLSPAASREDALKVMGFVPKHPESAPESSAKIDSLIAEKSRLDAEIEARQQLAAARERQLQNSLARFAALGREIDRLQTRLDYFSKPLPPDQSTAVVGHFLGAEQDPVSRESFDLDSSAYAKSLLVKELFPAAIASRKQERAALLESIKGQAVESGIDLKSGARTAGVAL